MFVVKEQKRQPVNMLSDLSKHGTYDDAAKALETYRKKKPDGRFYVVKRERN